MQPLNPAGPPRSCAATGELYFFDLCPVTADPDTTAGRPYGGIYSQLSTTQMYAMQGNRYQGHANVPKEHVCD